ncbi:hypothetical protein M404DRAFT_149003 [Pisolithus tinctorius Marx 270]|uniref:Uncharacterized protein n=1 Tax=Pisolithus tinctorius Marx 270 TaxID=870435 RepID=A0A0C3P3J3_PISTI|nr:hypothetical protein M404DRAFT_149003 [Pisolithus tinctorius Marx 270]
MHSSTRNCRIERLWVEVGSQFARRWRAFFARLECWNCHPMGGAGTNNKSPMDMCLLGQIQFGIYRECEDREGCNVADDEVMETADAIARQQQVHVKHEAVRVPSLRNPFQNDEEELTFFRGLQEVVTQDITPENFGLTATEWSSDTYPLIETIHIGRRARKEVDISLADAIWYSRARLWCQALSTLSFYLMTRDSSFV